MAIKTEIRFLQDILTDEDYVKWKQHVFMDSDTLESIDKFAYAFQVINKKIVGRLIELAEQPSGLILTLRVS